MLSFFRFQGNKCKTQCDLAVSRIRLLRNKRQIRLKQARRDIADLLRAGKTESARIRVEAVLRDAALLRAFDVLELHAELLGVRAAVVERHDAKAGGVPADMVECVSSLAYAAVRAGAEVPELPAISKMLAKKFGGEWQREAADDATRAKWHVNEALARALAVEVPPPSARLACLREVAKEHGVTFDEAAVAAEMGADEGGSGAGGGGGGGSGGGGTTAAKAAAAAAAAAATTAAVPAAEPAPAAAPAPAPAEFQDAAAAAAAARAAADRATAAADEAARLAGKGGSGDGGGKPASSPTAAKKGGPPPAGTPPKKAAPPPPPPPPAGAAGASMDEGEGSVTSQPLSPAQGEGQPDEPAAPSSGTAGGSASLGLPSPPDNSAGGGGRGGGGSSGGGGGAGSASMGLPPPPTGGGGAGVVSRPPPAGGVDNELDELAARLASLKKK